MMTVLLRLQTLKWWRRRRLFSGVSCICSALCNYFTNQQPIAQAVPIKPVIGCVSTIVFAPSAEPEAAFAISPTKKDRPIKIAMVHQLNA